MNSEPFNKSLPYCLLFSSPGGRIIDGDVNGLLDAHGQGGVRTASGTFVSSDSRIHADALTRGDGGKLVVWAEDRPSACARMIRALEECVILGVKTPIEFLLDVLSSPDFLSGDTHTRLLDENFRNWKPGARGTDMALLGFKANEMVGPGVQSVPAGDLKGNESRSPWHTLGNWDLVSRDQ